MSEETTTLRVKYTEEGGKFVGCEVNGIQGNTPESIRRDRLVVACAAAIAMTARFNPDGDLLTEKDLIEHAISTIKTLANTPMPGISIITDASIMSINNQGGSKKDE